MTTREIGRYGEILVSKFLISQSYKILYTNWFCYAGELDLVALSKHNVLTFIEVKYVRSAKVCYPEQLLTKTKLFHLKRTITKFFSTNTHFSKYEWQLDLITIYNYKLTHIKDITAALGLGLALEFHQ